MQLISFASLRRSADCSKNQICLQTTGITDPQLTSGSEETILMIQLIVAELNCILFYNIFSVYYVGLASSSQKQLSKHNSI